MYTRVAMLVGALCLFSGCDDTTTTDPGGGSGGPGGGASPVPVYVLVGGSSVPTVADVYRDVQGVGGGEIFVMSKTPLAINTLFEFEYAVTAGGTDYTGSFRFTTSASQVMAPRAGSVLGEINLYRSDSGYLNADLLASGVGYIIAARRHAGYQKEPNSFITHNEPDNTKVFFMNNSFASRISIAHGGTAVSNSWGGSNTVYEIIASNGGLEAIPFLWNTVYHRVPMMRRHTRQAGNGDSADAVVDTLYVNANPKPYPIEDAGAFQTVNLGGTSSFAQTLATWPAPNQTGIGTTFNTNSELPDPMSAANGTPAVNAVGTPIHIILPTTANVTAISVTLTANP